MSRCSPYKPKFKRCPTKTELQCQSKIFKLKTASLRNLDKWIDSNKSLIIDRYPQRRKVVDVGKMNVNNYFSREFAGITFMLYLRGYKDSQLYALVLDGPTMTTSMMLAKKNSLPVCNVLVPNFTNAYFSMSSRFCTPLFMPVGPIVPPTYQNKFPKEVKLSNFISETELTSLLFVAVWLDYCASPATVIEDLIEIIPKLKFAPMAIFGVTVSYRQRGKKWTMPEFKNYVHGLLEDYNPYLKIKFSEEFLGRSVATFFWTIDTA